MSNLINKAYKFRFYPQNDLKEILAKTFGCTRFVYNQTLAFSETHYAQKPILESQGLIYKSLTEKDRVNFVKTLKDSIELDPLNPNFNQLKYPWLFDVSSVSLQQSAKNLHKDYSRFFKGQSGKPNFKAKHINHNSFTITGQGSIHFDNDFAKNYQFCLPKYKKPLNIKWGKSNKAGNKTTKRLFNHLAVSSFTISQNPSGQYFISFLVKEEFISKDSINNKVSFDLGLKTMAKVYQGKIDAEGKPVFQDFNLPDLLKAIDKKLRKSQRNLSRREKESKNRDKQRLIVARIHQKRVNIIQDYYQKKSTKLVNENQEIILEDLNISGMKKNRKLSRAIYHVAWKRFVSMIEYKSKWNKRLITKANRFYPSSKTCSKCGHIHHGLKLKDRTWTCPGCNAQHDRDENACINLYNYKHTVGTTVNACGGNYFKSNDLSRIVRPKKTKKIISKSLMANSSESNATSCIKAGIHVL